MPAKLVIYAISLAFLRLLPPMVVEVSSYSAAAVAVLRPADIISLRSSRSKVLSLFRLVMSVRSSSYEMPPEN